MKRWRRLVSSLLLVCLLLGSGGSLVADAATLDFSNPHTWEFGSTVNIDDLSNFFRLHSSLPSGLFAYITNLDAGANYTLVFDMAFYYVGSNSSVSVFVQNSSDGSSFALFDQNISGEGSSYKHKVDFKVPDNFVNPRLTVLVSNAQQMIFYRSNSLTDNSTDKGILNSIKEGFAKLWEWLKSILDNIKEIPAKIGQFITALGDRIKTFFTDLVNNMRNFFTSLGDRISGFFNDIWEKIKAFFLPREGYFDEYSVAFNSFIDEHFGFLAQLPDELSLIINTLVNYTPADPPYIDFPTVKVPIPGHEFTLIQGQKYVFTILTQSPYNMLYSAYQGFVWLAYCLMLFNFLKHKYNVIFGGDGSAD